MSFKWEEFLNIAQALIYNRDLQQLSAEAKYRCAISRAYFGAFCTARNFLRDFQEDPDISQRPEIHRYVRTKFEISPNPRERSIGENLKRLHHRRKLADYEDNLRDPEHKAQESLRLARQVIKTLRKLMQHNTRTC